MSYYQTKTILTVWAKAKEADGYDSSIWRKDFAGAWIRRDSYGLRNEYGWVIGKKVPASENGTDELSNIEAMHWKNCEAKADNYPNFFSVLSSHGDENIENKQAWVIQTEDR